MTPRFILRAVLDAACFIVAVILLCATFVTPSWWPQ
jgi:hypothetical protein